MNITNTPYKKLETYINSGFFEQHTIVMKARESIFYGFGNQLKVLLFLNMKTSTVQIIFLTCFLFFTTSFFSQNSRIDSLQIELQNHKEKDTTTVNLLNELAFSYFSNDMAKTIEYLDEADEIAEVIDFKKGKGRSIYIRGITEAIQANYEQALRYYNQALHLYENIDLKTGVANCYNAMGIVYKNKGELKKAVLYFKKAIGMEEEVGGKNLAAALINLGAVYQDLGEFDDALSSLKKALFIAEANENEQRVAYSLNNLGTIYKEQGNYPLALEHFKKSLYSNEKLGDSISIAHGHFNIGSIYKTQKYYGRAILNYQKSLGIYERINSKNGISSILNGIGTVHEENGDYKSALDHYVKALNISKEIGAKRDIPNILNNIGGINLALNNYKTAIQYFTDAKKICIETGDKKVLCEAYIGLARTYANQKEYKSALSNSLKAKKISKKLGFLICQKDALEILSKIYNASGSYKDALVSHQQFKLLNDSLFNKENIEKITQLEYEYKYKQALDSASIRELQLTKTVTATNLDLEKSQRNYLWAIIGVLLVSILLGSIIFYQKFNNMKTKNENILMEQKLLRSQMTPHFIFNSLSVLQGMILNKEDKKSVSYLSKFSKLLRLTLENSRDKTVLLSEEMAAVENYLALQNLENEGYHYDVNVEDKIDTSALKIPPMLIQPFIENAVEHAFTSVKGDKKIEVNLMYNEEKLSCTITDNGIGVDSHERTKTKDKKSLATTITSERLEILSRDLKMKGSITVEDRKKYNEQGTLVTLVIPYTALL